MKSKFILCLALVLCGGLFGCSTARHSTASTSDIKFNSYDLRPSLYAYSSTNGYWQNLSIKLKQSKVPTEEQAERVAISNGLTLTDDRETCSVTALFKLAHDDVDFGKADDLVWEVRKGWPSTTSGLAWVDAFTGKVKILYFK